MDPDGPVTVVVRHRIKPGLEADFEVWQRGISHASLQFPGHLGYHIIRPADSRGEYLVMFRFDSLANLEAWEKSDERRLWLDRVTPLVAQPPTMQKHTGMEVWFTPPAGRSPPPRYKMVVVTFVALYPLLSITAFLIAPHIADWPYLLRMLPTTILTIILMTYFAMPFVTRLLTGWLYPKG